MMKETDYRQLDFNDLVKDNRAEEQKDDKQQAKDIATEKQGKGSRPKKLKCSTSQRGRSSDSPCMIVFCSLEQMPTLIDAAKKHGFVHHIALVFIKHGSPQALKANMRIVGATEYALLLYRGKLPKFRNGVQVDENGKNIIGTGHMVYNWFEWEKDEKDVPKIHATQKPIKVLKKLIEVCTDPGDVVIDPCCGSGSTLRAAFELGRSAYGLEIDRNFFENARDKMLDEEMMIKRSVFAGDDAKRVDISSYTDKTSKSITAEIREAQD